MKAEYDDTCPGSNQPERLMHAHTDIYDVQLQLEEKKIPP